MDSQQIDATHTGWRSVQTPNANQSSYGIWQPLLNQECLSKSVCAPLSTKLEWSLDMHR
jgi:hypothetical protein